LQEGGALAIGSAIGSAFGSGAVVLEPEALREEVRRELEAAAARYGREGATRPRSGAG